MPSLSDHAPRYPMLVIPDHKNTIIGEADAVENLFYPITCPNRSLFSLLKKQPLENHQIELPTEFLSIQRFCGSSCGWLISCSFDNKGLLRISLFKPSFSTSTTTTNSCNNIITNLPPIIHTIKGETCYRSRGVNIQDWDINEIQNLNLSDNHYVVKAVLSCDPVTNPDDYIIMVLFDPANPNLACIRPATDDTWTYAEDYVPGAVLSDVIYYKDRIYVVDRAGKVAYCDDLLTRGEEDCTWWLISGRDDDDDKDRCPFTERYLVESVDGDLLQVVRYYPYYDSSAITSGKDGCSKKRTTKFKVFKLTNTSDHDCKHDEWCGCKVCVWNNKWTELKSIGDNALFVGDSNGSTSVRASELDGYCCPNSIYFTASDTSPFFDPFGYTDIGIFHLEQEDDETIEPFIVTTRAMTRQPPFWITTVPLLLD